MTKNNHRHNPNCQRYKRMLSQLKPTSHGMYELGAGGCYNKQKPTFHVFTQQWMANPPSLIFGHVQPPAKTVGLLYLSSKRAGSARRRTNGLCSPWDLMQTRQEWSSMCKPMYHHWLRAPQLKSANTIRNLVEERCRAPVSPVHAVAQ